MKIFNTKVLIALGVIAVSFLEGNNANRNFLKATDKGSNSDVAIGKECKHSDNATAKDLKCAYSEKKDSKGHNHAGLCQTQASDKKFVCVARDDKVAATATATTTTTTTTNKVNPNPSAVNAAVTTGTGNVHKDSNNALPNVAQHDPLPTNVGGAVGSVATTGTSGISKTSATGPTQKASN